MYGCESSVFSPLSFECRYFGGLLVGCVNGVSKEELLSPCYSPIPNYWRDNKLVGVHVSYLLCLVNLDETRMIFQT